MLSMTETRQENSAVKPKELAVTVAGAAEALQQ